MTPWPGAFTSWNGKNLKLLNVRPLPGGMNAVDKVGLVVSDEDGAAALTKQGKLLLEAVQLAGKKATSIEDFLRGRPDFIGSKLG